MEVISTFFICVVAGFFLYPLMLKLAPVNSRETSEDVSIMKDSMRQMKENVKSPFAFVRQIKFRLKK
jgi:hypothetical protein